MEELASLLSEALKQKVQTTPKNIEELHKELISLHEDIYSSYSKNQLTKAKCLEYSEQIFSLQFQLSLSYISSIESHGNEIISLQEDVKDDWHISLLGEWKEGSSGGCLNENSWRDNEQYLLQIETPGTVEIHLEQIEEEIQPIGFYIFKGFKFQQIVGNPTVVSKSAFKKSKIVTCSVELYPSSDGYVILPCTYYPNLFQKFKLSIKGNETKTLIKRIGPKDKLFSRSLQGYWKGKTAAGCRNNQTWVYNPQFYVSTCKEDSYVHILVEQKEKKEFNPLGVYLFSYENVPASKVMNPQNLFAKSEFLSEFETYLITKIDNFIVIPCTFDTSFESTFQITVYSEDQNISLRELLESNEIKTSGDWKGVSAGGSPSIAKSWRNNPQYRVTLGKKSNVTIRLVQNSKEDDFHRIGFFVFKNSNYRKLVARPTDLLTSSDFTIKRDVTCSLEIGDGDDDLSFIIMPCTHEKGLEANFDLSIFVPSDCPAPTIQPFSQLKEISVQGQWTEATAGGRLTSDLWRKNPQYIISTPNDAQIFLCLSTKEEQKIGFYLVKSNARGEKIYSITEEDIVKKAPFRKSTETYCSFFAKANYQYNIIPCTFVGGILSSFTVTAYAIDDTLISLTPAEQFSHTPIKGEWRGTSSGGCINNRSWWNNPRYQISVGESSNIDLVLVQLNDKIFPIGYYLMSEDYCDKGSQGIVERVPFEPSIDVSLSLQLEGGRDYVLVPSTFHPGDESEFEIHVYSQNNISITPLPFLTEEEIDNMLYSNTIEDDENENENDTENDTEKTTVYEQKTEELLSNKSVVKTSAEAEIKDNNHVITKRSEESFEIINSTPIEVIAQGSGIPPAPIPPPSIKSVGEPKIKPPVVPPMHCNNVSDKSQLLSQIVLGSKLRKVTVEEKQKRSMNLPFAFNMEKIIARRLAMEESDEEDDNNDSEDWF